MDGGRSLIGGSPLRVLRLSQPGADLIDGLVAGAPVPPSGSAQALARKLIDAGLAHPRPCPSEGGPMKADVTLVVPVRDRAGGLARTLATAGAVGAVVVVDDGSQPAQARALAEVVGQAAGPGPAGTGIGHRLVRHDHSRGPAAARNTGWARARTGVVAFLDADCEPEPGWLQPLLAHLADPQVGAVAARVISGASGPGRRSARLEAYERRRSPLDMGPRPAAVGPGSPVSYVPTAALVVRRRALEQVGGLDPSLRAGEDVDLVWRLGQAGWDVRYEPASRVMHPARGDVSSWMAQRLAYGRSAGALHRRHPGLVPAVAVPPLVAAAWALTAAGRPGAGMALVASGTARLAARLDNLDHPWKEGARLVARAHAAGGLHLVEALRRPWWPTALALVLPSRRRRRAALAVGVLASLWRWLQARPALGWWTWLGLRLLDDLAYGAGVWIGCVEHATLGPLCPAAPRRTAKFGHLGGPGRGPGGEVPA